MSKINKTITTSVLEYVKTGAIIALVVGVAAFYMGVQYQRSNAVTVQNSVIVQSGDNTPEAKK